MKPLYAITQVLHDQSGTIQGEKLLMLNNNHIFYEQLFQAEINAKEEIKKSHELGFNLILKIVKAEFSDVKELILLSYQDKDNLDKEKAVEETQIPDLLPEAGETSTTEIKEEVKEDVAV